MQADVPVQEARYRDQSVFFGSFGPDHGRRAVNHPGIGRGQNILVWTAGVAVAVDVRDDVAGIAGMDCLYPGSG